MIEWYNPGTVVRISGSPIDISGSSININIKGSSNLNKEEIVKIVNDSLKKSGIKRKTIK